MVQDSPSSKMVGKLCVRKSHIIQTCSYSFMQRAKLCENSMKYMNIKEPPSRYQRSACGSRAVLRRSIYQTNCQILTVVKLANVRATKTRQINQISTEIWKVWYVNSDSLSFYCLIDFHIKDSQLRKTTKCVFVQKDFCRK